MSDETEWKVVRKRSDSSRVIELGEGDQKSSTPEERAAWETKSWGTHPSKYGMFNPSKEKSWLASRRNRGGDFRESTNPQKLFQKSFVLPIFTVLFIIFDLGLLYLLLKYLLGW